MTEPTEPEGLTKYPENWPRCPVCGDYALDGHITCGRAQCNEGDARLQAYLALGAEPFWMQDVRLAARRIQEQRRALRERARGPLPEGDSDAG